MTSWMRSVARLIAVLLTVSVFGLGAGAPAHAATAKHHRRSLGLVAVRPAGGASHTLTTRAHALDVLPASVDLTADAPTAGDQGWVSSCVSWAIDYALMGWYLRHDGRTGAPLAPMYTYSQLVDGQNVGTYFSDTFDIAQEQGVDTRSHYAQGDYDYVTLPTESEIANASHWRISGYESLGIGFDPADTKVALQTAMAAGKPVVLGIPVYDNFFDVSAAHPDYSSVSGSYEGGHAITAFGYDAYGVTIENSWGTSWGDDGFARLSWSFIDNYAFAGYTIDGLVAGPDVATVAPRIGTIDGGTEVTITGVGLSGNTSVSFGGVAGTDVAVNDSGTQITVTTPAHEAGALDVTVTTDDGTSAVNSHTRFRYEGAPTVSAVSTRSGPTKGGTVVKVTGTNLFGATATIGGTAQTVSVNSSGTIVTIQTRAKTAGAYSIAVTTPVGEVSGGGFTFVAPPTISTVSVRWGSYKGGTKVTITGARLAGAQVTIGGKSAKQLSSGATKLVIVTPAGTIGVHGAVAVKTIGGSVSSGTFTWVR